MRTVQFKSGIQSMATRCEWIRTIGWTVAFFILLFTLSIAQNNLSVISIEPVIVLTALAPVLLFLVSSGQLKRFSGGGFEVVFQKQARKLVSSNKIDIKTATISTKATQDKISEIKDDSPDALLFTLGNSDYNNKVIRKYLDNVQTLKYIVFNNKNGTFKGYISIEDFDKLVPDYEVEDPRLTQYTEVIYTDIASQIEDEDKILDHKSVIEESVEQDSSNEDALKRMVARGINELAVVNSNDEFIGVVTQDEIVRNILSSIITDSTT